MAESPGTPAGRSRVSILAERFGMTNEEVEELLRSTREEYAAPSASVPEAVVQPIPETGVVVRPDSPEQRPVSGVFLAVLFAVLLIALVIAMSLQHGWFQQRSQKPSIAQTDTIHNLPNRASQNESSLSEKSSDTASDQVPPDMLAAAREKHPAASAKPHASRAKHQIRSERTSLKPALTTSSNFEAEEQLAELRADGESKAHIKTTRKGGSVKYQVFEK